jgi:hypothetical protein
MFGSYSVRVLSLAAMVIAAASAFAFVSGAEARPAGHFAIAFERSGGPKRNFETLVVSPGLHAYATAPKGTVEGSKSFKMDAGTAEEVRRELAAAHFSRLRSRPLPTGCPGCYAYSITYHGHTVLFPDSKAPKGLDEVIDALEEEVILHLYRHPRDEEEG